MLNTNCILLGIIVCVLLAGIVLVTGVHHPPIILHSKAMNHWKPQQCLHQVMILRLHTSGRIDVTTKMLEANDGDMLTDPQFVFDGAEEMGKMFRLELGRIQEDARMEDVTTIGTVDRNTSNSSVNLLQANNSPLVGQTFQRDKTSHTGGSYQVSLCNILVVAAVLLTSKSRDITYRFHKHC